MPAKSMVKPPGTELIPNPERPTNPFTETSVPDWAKKNVTNLGKAASVRSNSSTSPASIAPSKVGPRGLAPPYNPSDLPLLPQRLPPPLEPTKHKPVMTPPPPAPRQTAPAITISSRPSTGKLQKPLPPAVPRKPAVLSARDNQRSSLDELASFQRPSLTGGTPTPSMMFPPPPRRVGTTPLPPTGNMTVAALRDDIRPTNPALPPRRGAGKGGGLMDDDEAEMGGMHTWQPLRPS